MAAQNRTKIKLCGLFRREDIGYANQVRPDYVGFVLAQGFRRRIGRESAEQFRKLLDPQIPAVGVFVNDPCGEVIDYLQAGVIQAAQLHGNETEEDIQYIKAATSRPVTKAVKVTSRNDVEAWLDSSADFLLFDGGTGAGVGFDWSLLAGLDRDFFLAGGLNPLNLKEAIDAVHPYAVDISSGVETEGVKDLEKMRRAVEIVRGM